MRFNLGESQLAFDLRNFATFSLDSRASQQPLAKNSGYFSSPLGHVDTRAAAIRIGEGTPVPPEKTGGPDGRLRGFAKVRLEGELCLQLKDAR
jgi:hypothetical protein